MDSCKLDRMEKSFSFEIFGRTGKIDINGFGGSYGTETLTHYKMKPEMGPLKKILLHIIKSTNHGKKNLKISTLLS